MNYFDKVQIVAIIASVLIIVLIIELIRRKKIREEYSLLWLFTGIIVLVFSLWREGLHIISDLIGIAYPPTTLVLILVGGIFSVLVHFSMVISKLTEKNKSLVQELGLLRYEFEKLKKTLSEKDDNEPPGNT